MALKGGPSNILGSKISRINYVVEKTNNSDVIVLGGLSEVKNSCTQDTTDVIPKILNVFSLSKNKTVPSNRSPHLTAPSPLEPKPQPNKLLNRRCAASPYKSSDFDKTNKCHLYNTLDRFSVETLNDLAKDITSNCLKTKIPQHPTTFVYRLCNQKSVAPSPRKILPKLDTAPPSRGGCISNDDSPMVKTTEPQKTSSNNRTNNLNLASHQRNQGDDINLDEAKLIAGSLFLDYPENLDEESCNEQTLNTCNNTATNPSLVHTNSDAVSLTDYSFPLVSSPNVDDGRNSKGLLNNGGDETSEDTVSVDDYDTVSAEEYDTVSVEEVEEYGENDSDDLADYNNKVKSMISGEEDDYQGEVLRDPDYKPSEDEMSSESSDISESSDDGKIKKLRKSMSKELKRKNTKHKEQPITSPGNRKVQGKHKIKKSICKTILKPPSTMVVVNSLGSQQPSSAQFLSIQDCNIAPAENMKTLSSTVKRYNLRKSRKSLPNSLCDVKPLPVATTKSTVASQPHVGANYVSSSHSSINALIRIVDNIPSIRQSVSPVCHPVVHSTSDEKQSRGTLSKKKITNRHASTTVSSSFMKPSHKFKENCKNQISTKSAPSSDTTSEKSKSNRKPDTLVKSQSNLVATSASKLKIDTLCCVRLHGEVIKPSDKQSYRQKRGTITTANKSLPMVLQPVFQHSLQNLHGSASTPDMTSCSKAKVACYINPSRQSFSVTPSSCTTSQRSSYVKKSSLPTTPSSAVHRVVLPDIGKKKQLPLSGKVIPSSKEPFKKLHQLIRTSSKTTPTTSNSTITSHPHIGANDVSKGSSSHSSKNALINSLDTIPFSQQNVTPVCHPVVGSSTLKSVTTSSVVTTASVTKVPSTVLATFKIDRSGLSSPEIQKKITTKVQEISGLLSNFTQHKEMTVNVRWHDEAALDPWKAKRSLKAYQDKRSEVIQETLHANKSFQTILSDSPLGTMRSTTDITKNKPSRKSSSPERGAKKTKRSTADTTLTLRSGKSLLQPKPIKSSGLSSLTSPSTNPSLTVIDLKEMPTTGKQSSTAMSARSWKSSTDPDFMVAKSVLYAAINSIVRNEKKELQIQKRHSILLEMKRAKEAVILGQFKRRLKLQTLRKREIFEGMILQEIRMEMKGDARTMVVKGEVIGRKEVKLTQKQDKPSERRCIKDEKGAMICSVCSLNFPPQRRGDFEKHLCLSVKDTLSENLSPITSNYLKLRTVPSTIPYTEQTPIASTVQPAAPNSTQNSVNVQNTLFTAPVRLCTVASNKPKQSSMASTVQPAALNSTRNSVNMQNTRVIARLCTVLSTTPHTKQTSIDSPALQTTAPNVSRNSVQNARSPSPANVKSTHIKTGNVLIIGSPPRTYTTTSVVPISNLVLPPSQKPTVLIVGDPSAATKPCLENGIPTKSSVADKNGVQIIIINSGNTAPPISSIGSSASTQNPLGNVVSVNTFPPPLRRIIPRTMNPTTTVFLNTTSHVSAPTTNYSLWTEPSSVQNSTITLLNQPTSEHFLKTVSPTSSVPNEQNKITSSSLITPANVVKHSSSSPILCNPLSCTTVNEKRSTLVDTTTHSQGITSNSSQITSITATRATNINIPILRRTFRDADSDSSRKMISGLGVILGENEKLFPWSNRKRILSKFIPNSGDETFLSLLGMEECLKELYGDYFGRKIVKKFRAKKRVMEGKLTKKTGKVSSNQNKRECEAHTKSSGTDIIESSLSHSAVAMVARTDISSSVTNVIQEDDSESSKEESLTITTEKAIDRNSVTKRASSSSISTVKMSKLNPEKNRKRKSNSTLSRHLENVDVTSDITSKIPSKRLKTVRNPTRFELRVADKKSKQQEHNTNDCAISSQHLNPIVVLEKLDFVKYSKNTMVE